MFLHQIVLNGTFDNNGFRPVSFLIKKGECHIINKLLYTEYWMFGLEKYVVSIKGNPNEYILLYDKHREKWFIPTEIILDKEDIPIKNINR